MRHLAVAATRTLQSSAPILILGETGVGKGVLARWLHAHGRTAGGELVDVDCTADAAILDNELFGYRRLDGRSVLVKEGLIEVAHGGTLFLDEIGGLDREIQEKVFRALTTGQVHRRGDDEARPIDVRLITTSNRPLAGLSTKIHDELWQRVLTLEIPPLRERPEDVAYLAQSLLSGLADSLGRPTISPAALRALARHSWPGNVRELKNVLERASIFSTSREIGPQDLQFETLGSAWRGVA